MTEYELFNLQRGIGDIQGIIKQQEINPKAFSPIENWVINHLKIRELEKKMKQEKELKKEVEKEVERVVDEVVKGIEKNLKL